MDAVQIANTAGMSHQDWLNVRRRGIGGSDAAAIAGLSKWKSPMSVYLEKIGEVESEAGEAAYWGLALEDVIVREYAKRSGLRVKRRNAVLQHREHKFMIANIDRIVGNIYGKGPGTGVLEIKTTSAYNKDAWSGDKIPDEYMIQVQHYLAVTGYRWAAIAVLIGGQEYQERLVIRDWDIISYLIEIERDFWKLVENRTPPEIDGSKASTDVLNLLYPRSEEKSEILLPDDAVGLIDQYQTAAGEEKAAAGRKDEAANKLKAMLGECEAGYIGDRRVTWKTAIQERVDSKKLKAEHPKIFKKYAKVSPYRRFAIK